MRGVRLAALTMKGNLGQSTSSRVFAAIQRVEEVFLAGGILVIATLTIGNVFARTLTGRSLAFAEEISQFAMIFVTFIGASYAASKGRHIRMSAIYDNLSQRWQKATMLVITAITAVLMLVLTYYAVRYALTVRALGTVSPVLQVPLWLIYLAAPIGLALAAVQYAMAFFRNLTAEDVYLSFDKKDEYEDVVQAI